MKNLKDSIKDAILEKLKVDDILLDKEEFPIDGTLNDIIEFLKDNGFEYVECRGGIDEYFNKYKSKCFYKNDVHLWFGDTSKEKISKKNPIFSYRFLFESFGVYYCVQDDVCWLVGENYENSKENKKEFLEELNKRFGWE